MDFDEAVERIRDVATNETIAKQTLLYDRMLCAVCAVCCVLAGLSVVVGL